MNNEIEYLVSQMTPGQLNAFINQSFPDLVGGNFMFRQGQTEQDKKRIVADRLSKAVASPAVDATQEAVLNSLGRYVSPEVQQSQQSRTANIGNYTNFDDESYGAVPGSYDDFNYDLLDDSAYISSAGIQKSTGASQAPLDIAGVQNAIAQDPNWQPRNDYERWALGFIRGEDSGVNPTVVPVNTNRTAGIQTPKTQGEKYQFNVLENRENRTANIPNIPIPKPVGIKTDLLSGLVYDYNRGLVFNPVTGVTQKLISDGRTIPTKLEIPNLIQGEQSNSIPVPSIRPNIGFNVNQNPEFAGDGNFFIQQGNQLTRTTPGVSYQSTALSSNNNSQYKWHAPLAIKNNSTLAEYTNLSPQARQYLIDRQWNRDKERAYIQQQQEVDNQITDGEGRFFDTASYIANRDNSVPYPRTIGIAPRIAGVGQEYSPEVMSRIGQGGFLNNAGSIKLPNTWIDKETNQRVFSKGRGTPATIVYTGDKEGSAIPSISIPRIQGGGNELISFKDALERELISPEQYNNYTNQAAQTKFIPASNMDSFNRDNIKLYETTDNQGKNYRATYMNPLTKEVFNVTQNGGFYLVRPAVSEESGGLPIRKQTTNLAQEMTEINRVMREGSRDNLVDIIREDPTNPGLEAFTRPVPAINPITGETINKYVHTGNLVNPETLQPEAIQAGVDYSQYAVLDKEGNPIPTDNFIEIWDKRMGTPKPPNVQLLGEASRNAFKPVARKWVDDNNPQDLFNYFNVNQESQGASMQALDLSRGGSRTAGVRKAPADMYISPYLDYDAAGNLQLRRNFVPERGETTIFNSGNPITVSAPTGYQDTNATSAYPSLQETDYLGGRLAFNTDGNIVDIDNIQSTIKNPEVTYLKSYEEDTRPFEIINGQEYVIDPSLPAPREIYTPYYSGVVEQRISQNPNVPPKGINNFTPASEFTSSSPQLVRDTRTGKVIYDPNRTVYVRTDNTGLNDDNFAVVPYKEDRYQKTGTYQVNRPVYGERQNLSLNQRSRRVADVPESGNPNPPTVYTPANLQVSRQQTIEDYEPGTVDVFGVNANYPGDFTNTKFYRFKTNPETPLAAYKVSEYGTPIPNEYGFPEEVLTPLYGNPLTLPRSAQIANKAEFISRPRLMVQDFKGITPDYQPIPDGMSYEEADRKGLLNPIFNSRTAGLNSSYQIPLPKGVGLARVLDESNPRTQAAIAAQVARRQIPSLVQQSQSILADNSFTPEEKKAKVDELFVQPLAVLGGDEVDALIKIAKKGESKPAFDRKYTITPSRTAGVESPQYTQYLDLATYDDSPGLTFWKENIPGVVPQGVIDGAYLPVTTIPRPINKEGKKGWLINDQIYTTESGRQVRGDKAVNYVNIPLNLDSVSSYLPKSKREELELKGFSDDAIEAWANVNPNLARDNALANAKILIDGKYYDVTPQATVAEFNPVAGGNYAMAETRSQGRAARIDLPFKAGANISEPTPEWIAQQAVGGNLRFNADDYISPDDKAILNQKEVYNAGYEEPTDILGAISRVQQRKNQIDAVISNRKQRQVAKPQSDIEVLKYKSEVLGKEAQEARTNIDRLRALQQKAQIDLLIDSPQQRIANNLDGKISSSIDENYTTLGQDRSFSINPEILPLSDAERVEFIRNYQPNASDVLLETKDVAPVQSTRPRDLQEYSNYLAEEINRASAAHNAIVNIEDSPEVVIKRQGNPQQLNAFISAANTLGMQTEDDSFRYKNNPDEKLTASVTGSLPNTYLPYEQAQELNESRLYHPRYIQDAIESGDFSERQIRSMQNARLLPAYRTQQKVELPTVPTSNVAKLGRVKFVEDYMGNPESILGGMGFDGGSIPGDYIPNPSKVIQQFVPAGNQVINIVPSSSENYQYRSGGNADYGIWDMPVTNDLGGMGFDGGSIPGDDIPRQVRTNVQQGVQSEPQQVRTPRTPGTQSFNTPINPEVKITGGMKIPKWAIPATLGAVWLGLAANARRQQDEDRRQQQGVVNRY